MNERNRLLAFFGLQPTATLDEARAAYRAKARALHPDRVGGDARAMAQANANWDRLQMILLNPSHDHNHPTERDNTASGGYYTLDTNAYVQHACAEFTFEILANLFDERIAMMMAMPRMQRWLGAYTLSPHHKVWILWPHHLGFARDGRWTMTFAGRADDVVGDVMFLVPDLELRLDRRMMFHQVRGVSAHIIKGENAQYGTRRSGVGFLRFSISPHQEVPTIQFNTQNTTWMAQVATLHTLGIGKKALRFQAMAQGTAPHWIRPLLQGCIKVQSSWTKMRTALTRRLGSWT